MEEKTPTGRIKHGPQEYLTGEQTAPKLGISAQRLGVLAKNGTVYRRNSDGRYPWPRVEKEYKAWKELRPAKLSAGGKNVDELLSEQLRDPNTQSPPPALDPADLPVMDGGNGGDEDDGDQTALDHGQLRQTERVIEAIQKNIKNADATSYNWARALNEGIKARSAFLELMEQEGKTLKREEVENWLYQNSRHNRDIWLNWPQLVVAEAAEEVGCDANALYAILIRLVRENLDRIATLPTEFEGHHVDSVSEGAEAPNDT